MEISSWVVWTWHWRSFRMRITEEVNESSSFHDSNELSQAASIPTRTDTLRKVDLLERVFSRICSCLLPDQWPYLWQVPHCEDCEDGSEEVKFCWLRGDHLLFSPLTTPLFLPAWELYRCGSGQLCFASFAWEGVLKNIRSAWPLPHRVWQYSPVLGCNDM